MQNVSYFVSLHCIVISCSSFLGYVFPMLYWWNVVLSLCCLISEFDSYVFICMYVILIAYSSVIKFDYFFMNNYDFNFIVKGWSGGTCFPSKNTWTVTVFTFRYRDYLVLIWTNAFISLSSEAALDDEKLTMMVT